MEEEDEGEFEFCPHAWYREAKEEGGVRGSWRLAFLCLCLPVCYPCYLSRSLRIYLRRKGPRERADTVGNSNDREECLSPEQPGPSVQEKLRVDAMFLKSESSYQLLNKLSLRRVKGQNAAGMTYVSLGKEEFASDIYISFESSVCDTSVKDFPVSTTSSLLAQLHILVLAYRDETELLETLSRTSGILGYTSQYWRGYYPLLLVKLCNSVDFDQLKREALCLIEKNFSWCHRLQISESFNLRDQYKLMATLLKLYLHVFKLRCDVSGNEWEVGVPMDWECPGQCGLATQAQAMAGTQQTRPRSKVRPDRRGKRRPRTPTFS